MRIRHLLLAAGAALALCQACVDPEYALGNVETEGTLFRNMEVPIGSFEIITLKTILKAPGAALQPQSTPGTYTLTGSAEIAGVSFEFDEQLYFMEAELHTVILNTLPLDMGFSVTALDSEGKPCADVTVTVIADKQPAIASGRTGSPSENPVVLRLQSRGRYMSMDGLRLAFTGRTGAGFEGMTPGMDEGIKLTKVYLKMPEGLKVEL